MIFDVIYPTGLVEPKDFRLPKLEDIEKAIELAAMVVDYVDDFEEEDSVTIRVSDKISTMDGEMIPFWNKGFCEGIVLFPASSWSMEDVFEAILCNLFEG